MNRFYAPLAGLALALLSGPSFGQQARGVIYDFSAKWCGPCQKVAPVVEKLAREGLPVVRVDIDEQKEMANQFGVSSIPCFVLVVDGREIDRSMGLMSESDLRRMAARIPTDRPALANQGPPQRQNNSNIPVQLGEPGPMQPVQAPAMGPAEIRTVSNDAPRRSLFDRLPFGRKPAEEQPEVVRGNDATVAQDPAFVLASHTQDGPADPMQSSVRIRVITSSSNGRIDLGSGTVISSRTGVTRILTCAHIFRELTDDSRILVDQFDRGRTAEVAARLIKTDTAADLGLIEIPTSVAVPATKVGGSDGTPRAGDPVAAIGCSGGAEPTRQQLRVTDIDKYDGPHNILCTGVPVRGRSGGGLFNARGEIVGVCIAADEEQQRGFYSGLLAIHHLLDECSLKELYSPAMQPATPPQSILASATIENALPAANMAATQPVSTTAPAAPANPVDVSVGDAELVVLIRDKSHSNDGDRVMIIHNPSPKTLSYLRGEMGDGSQNSKLLGFAAPESNMLPAISRDLRTNQFNSIARESGTENSLIQNLRPTGLSRTMVPQGEFRSAGSGVTPVR